MSLKLLKFIDEYFDNQLNSELGLEGQHKIVTPFKELYTDQVIFINVRISHPKLKAEAQLVIEKLAKMISAKQGLKPVNVIFWAAD